MKKCDNTCHGCLWADSCNSNSRCEDFTPMDDEQDISYYEEVLRENDAEYRSLLSEVNS